MTEWKYPGDEAVRRAFAATVSKIVEEKGWTPEEFQRRLVEAARDLDTGLHERALGRAIKNLREERNMTRRALATLAGISVQRLIHAERGHSGQLSLSEVCRISAGLNLHPHELMERYQDAVKQAYSSQAWWTR
jgi:DNA-binding XRE family transcriptional regulator